MHVTFSIAGTTFLVFCVFAIAAAGYLLGRVTIQGVSLGTAGVFVAALLFGCFCYGSLSEQLTVAGATFVTDGLKIVENLGLMFFVTAVGFIAGPGFVHNFKQNFKSYVCLGLVITLFGGVACVLCILIAYLFGVVGVVLFVQLIPKLTHADLDRERDRLTQVSQNAARRTGRVCLDEFGLMPLALAIVCGIVVGSCKVGNFSLTTTGGCLLAGLVFGHFGRIGPVNLMPRDTTLKAMRELGLVLFLIGAGVAGGSRFAEFFHPIYFVYGILMTALPMVVGYLFAKHVLKLSLLTNLGSITGGMTSTPALGTLISVAKTEQVAAAYAATYPIALLSVVVISQVIILVLS